MVKPLSPLHPLPVPDQCCDSVAINFVGPLPVDGGYNTIITFMDHLSSNICIIPMVTSLTAEQFARIFFYVWFCKNRLPLEIVSDHDKLFVSCFWKRLHNLTRVKLNVSSAYHPETDGTSKRTNCRVIQCIHIAIECNQQGWAKALPKSNLIS